MSATPRQRAMIENLFKQKAVPDSVILMTREVMDRADATPREHVSPLIDGLMALPDAPRATVTTLVSSHPGRGPVNALLRDHGVPTSMYAIPANTLPAPAIRERYARANDHLFVVVGEFNETRYVKQLHGAPGSFTRTPFETVDDRLAVVTVLVEQGPRACAQIFGALYTCCGKCGAPLTDDRSRFHKLGPVCRKEFGL